jgi:hypothetical protein
LALPRGIDIPLAVNIDGSPTYFRNRLFQYHVNKGGMYNSVEWAWDDRGYVATLMDIIRPSQLIAVAESNNDVGKTIRVLGTDQNNRNLRAQTLNGTGVDGILIPIHSQQDFQLGTIAPDGNTIATREVAIDPITDFTTTAPHGLSSGQGMAARLISGTIPVPLNDGQTYYVGVIDAYTVQLFGDSLNAQALQYPIALQSIDGFGSMQLQDKRTAQVETSLKFVPPAPTFTIDSPNEVVFPKLSPAQSLPAPLEAQKTYFANPVDSTHLQIFPTLVDATNNTNPVYLTGSNNQISVDIRKAITPETKLVFSVRHYFNDGDQVQATTSGGALPQPLLSNQNYFVNVIDDYSVSLHSNISDALASTPINFVNPIEITTSGSGVVSLVKLISATATTGTQSQITAPTLSIGTPTGSNAAFAPIVVGSVVNVSVTNSGTNYTTTPTVVFDLPTEPPIGTVALIERRRATGVATRNSINNSITGIVITDPGSGYSSNPNVIISAPTNAPSVSIKTLTANQTIATCITTTPHTFLVNDTVEISGADAPNTIYNGSFSVTERTPTTFKYALPSSLGSPLPITSIKSGTFSITNITQANVGPNYTVTVTTSAAHGFSIGSKIFIVDVTNPSELNGLKTLVSVGTNTFTFNESAYWGAITIGTPRTWKPFNQVDPDESDNTLATAACVNHGVVIDQSVYIEGATIPGLNGQVFVESVVTNVSFTYQVAPLLSDYIGTAATVFKSPATGSNLLAKTPASSIATATCSIERSFVSYYNQLDGGDFYVDEPIVEVKAVNGGTGATAKATISNGKVTKLTPITSGSGYSGGAAVIITPSTNVFVNFSSTGALPSPLLSGTSYRAESPLNQGTGTFTVRNSDFSELNITSIGNGTLYVVLSRSFSVDFTNNWLGDFTSLTNGQQIYFGTDYILPTTTPPIDNGVTANFLNVVSNTLARVYTSSSTSIGGLQTTTIPVLSISVASTTATVTTASQHYHSTGDSVTIYGATPSGYNGTFSVVSTGPNTFTYTVPSSITTPATGSITCTTGLINIDSFGTGQTYYALRTQVTPSVDTNLIKPASLAFLTEGEVVQFSTSGTLPYPLSASTDYTIQLIGDSVRVYSGTNPIVLTTSGIGQLSLDIIRDVMVQPSNNIVAKSSLYETGTELVVRAKLNDVLPTGLVEGTNYYVRRIDNNSFELYDTLNHARNLISTTGRKTYTTPGNKVISTFFTDAIFEAVLVKSVAHIEKPLTDGYVSLYAWDYGRSNDMTLIGQYHPTEVNPQYRKIRIGKPCAWARILYKVTSPKVSSVYDFIPLEQERAIIAAVHAVDLEDKDFADQAVRYWGIAYQYLRNQQESIDGHAMTPPQVNGITYGDCSDVVMW